MATTKTAPKRKPGAAAWITPSLRALAVPIDRVKPDPDNARRHPEYNLQTIRQSLERFGQMKPLVCDRAGVVRAGNGTLEAARALGRTVIAAVFSDLTPAELAAYALADNRTGELSEWDPAKLSAALATLPEDLRGLVGWEGDDLRKAMGQGSSVVEDEAPEPLPTAETVRGDLWRLGEHLLLCGDSTNADDVERLLGAVRVDLVATDPPYLVDYTGDRPNDSGKDWTATYKEVDIKDADAFFRSVFTNMLTFLARGAAIYCWHAHKRQGLIAKVWEDLGILDHQQIVWVKPTPVFGRVFWHFRHEPCMMGWVKGSMPAHDGDQAISSVWEIDWEGKSRIVGNEHPTQKPVEIFARPMRKHTKEGGRCFEPFSGSGTQIIAAEQLRRRCYAIELEPVYVEVAVRRWQRLTGKRAERYGASGKKKHGIVAD